MDELAARVALFAVQCGAREACAPAAAPGGELGQERRRVSFLEAPHEVWRPVLYESLEEDLARRFRFVTDAESRVPNAALKQMHRFFERTQRAFSTRSPTGVKRFHPPDERFGREDAQRWSWYAQAEDGAPVEEVGHAVGVPALTQADIAALAGSLEAPPQHHFASSGGLASCSECGSRHSDWCTVCEECRVCHDSSGGKVMCELDLL
jgi:hypothetical protein